MVDKLKKLNKATNLKKSHHDSKVKKSRNHLQESKTEGSLCFTIYLGKPPIPKNKIQRTISDTNFDSSEYSQSEIINGVWGLNLSKGIENSSSMHRKVKL